MKEHIRREDGFSLMELIVVLILLAIITSAIIPVYIGSISSIQKEHAVRDIVSLMKYAQERAITDIKEYRVYLDPDEGSYWLKVYAGRDENDRDVKLFVDPPEPYVGKRMLPERLKMQRPEALRDRKEKAYYVAFQPNGACSDATLRFSQNKRGGGKRIIIDTGGSLGKMKVTVP